MRPSERINRAWGENLRSARKVAGFTQETFAERAGMSQESVSRYERGVAPWTPEVMLIFAVALDRFVTQLFPWPVGIEDAERYHQLPKNRRTRVA